MGAEIPPEEYKGFGHEETSPVGNRHNQNLVTDGSRGVRETERHLSLDVSATGRGRPIRCESWLNDLAECNCQRCAHRERAWGSRCGHCEEPPRWQNVLAHCAPLATHCRYGGSR